MSDPSRGVSWLGVTALTVGLACGPPPPSDVGAPERDTERQRAARDVAGGEIPAVGLGGLAGEWPEPGEGIRNPFRFSAARAGRSGPDAVSGQPGSPAGEDTASPRVPIVSGDAAATIPLKFIGLVDSDTAGTVAVLSDGQFVYHGRAGEIIEGRYRIVTIGVESIELELVDGSRRQTIRLSGS